MNMTFALAKHQPPIIHVLALQNSDSQSGGTFKK